MITGFNTDVKHRGTVYHVQFDDWMYLMDDHLLLNHSVITKFGFKVGSVFLSFNKP